MTKKKTKNIENSHSNPKEPSSQKVALIDEYHNFLSFKKEILTTSTLDRICQELIEWVCKEEEAIKINQFLALKGIPYGTWHNWMEKSEKLKEYVAHAKMIIGNRRELGAITRKFDSGNTIFMMPAYDVDWEKMLRLRAEIAEKKENSKGPGWVIIEKAANTDMVPVKESE